MISVSCHTLQKITNCLCIQFKSKSSIKAKRKDKFIQFSLQPKILEQTYTVSFIYLNLVSWIWSQSSNIGKTYIGCPWVSRHNGDLNKCPLKPLNTIVCDIWGVSGVPSIVSPWCREKRPPLGQLMWVFFSPGIAEPW